MSRNLLALSLVTSLMGGTAMAEVPRVAADIAPVHALVARVMEGLGTPDLIMQQGSSPHEYSLRPSEAQALQDANLVFWVGAGLSPWLAETIPTLAADADATELVETSGTIKLGSRNNALFEKHNHGAHEDEATAGHDDHAHDKEHDDHAHDKDHDDHAEHEDHAEHAEHAHGKNDPHAWLSPNNAMSWMNVIAGKLSAADPENAGTYFANAAAGRAEIAAVMAEVNAQLEPLRDTQFIVFHDAYQYFENDFDFFAAGAISLSDASDPSPARIAEIQARIADQGIDCVLAEPQFNAGLVATVLDGTQANTGIIDPLGADIAPGPAFYPQLIRNMASALAACK